jgi:hypothetical protein
MKKDPKRDELGIHLTLPHGIDPDSQQVKVSVKDKQIIIDLLPDVLGTVANQATGIKKIPTPPPPKGHQHLHDLLGNLKFKITMSNHPDQ